MIGPDDKQLAERIADGDRQAFDLLFRTLYGRVENFIRLLLRNKSVSEDLAQDVFANLWNSRHALRRVNSLDTYIYTAARNAVIDHMRRGHSSRFVTTELPDIAADNLTDERYFAIEKELLIRMAVENFPERRRLVFSMSRFDGLTNDEIARSLGISKKTVENQINLATRDLKKIIMALSAFIIMS